MVVDPAIAVSPASPALDGWSWLPRVPSPKPEIQVVQWSAPELNASYSPCLQTRMHALAEAAE